MFEIVGEKIDLSNRENWVLVIGSRKPSREEYETQYRLAQRLVKEKGCIIVSGLAEGLDTAAHLGALDAGGKSIAIVSTCKNEKIYPPSNIELAEKIKQNGCIIHPYSTKADWNASVYPRHPIRRLLERDLIAAYLCPRIYATCDKTEIDGGTRYAIKYGIEYGRKVWRVDTNGKFEENPKINERKNKCTISWKTEFDFDKLKEFLGENMQ